MPAAAATLTVINKVVTNNGGTAVASDWTMNITGSDVSNTGFPGSETGVTVSLDTGTYSVDESGGPQQGYTKIFSPGCAGIIAVGESRTCIITNDDISPQLRVVKTVVNDHGGSAVAGDWTMEIFGENVSNSSFEGAEGPGTILTLDAGTYSVGETGGPSGYASTLSAGCSGTISQGEEVTCIVTNYDIAPKLTVINAVVNAYGGSAIAGDWEINIAGTNVSSTGFDGTGLPGVSLTLNAGRYSVGESGGPSGYAITLSAGCSGSIDLGDETTCTITNYDIAPKLTVIKTVVNDDAGDALASEWTVDITGSNVSSTGFNSAGEPGVTITLDPGPYNVGESSGPSGYAITLSTDCSGTISLGDNLTCTITSNDISPNMATLTVIKKVVNDDGGVAIASDWTMDIYGQNVSSPSFSGSEAGVTVTLDAGSYSVSEKEGPPGYAMSFSPDCFGALSAGDALTCTVTNNDIAGNAPTLTMTTIVTTDNGGDAVVGDWIVGITGSGVSSSGFASSATGVTITLNPGAYSVTLGSGPFGYSITLSPECSGTIGLGDHLNCIITTDDIGPKLTVIKKVISGNGGSAVAGDWTMNISGINVSSTSFPGSAAGVAVTLNVGPYSVDEIGGPSGYTTSRSSNCFGIIKLGDELSCTITDQIVPPQLTVIKKMVIDGGGPAVAGDWAINIAGTNVSSTGFRGVDGKGVTISIDPGVYSVSESDGPSGYAMTLSPDCSGTIALGDDLTCTITSNDLNPRLTVVTEVINDNGSAVASDWTMNATGVNVSNTGFLGSEAGVTIDLHPGGYNVGQSGGPSGYAMSFSSDCFGTISLGDNLLCTIINDDIAPNIPSITVVKKVANDDGGSALASEWTITIAGTDVSSSKIAGSEYGVTVALSPGAYSVSKSSGPSGYTLTLSPDCFGAIEAAESLTCTISSDDIPGAFDAVANVPPVSSIVNPTNGSNVTTDLIVNFIGWGEDQEDGVLIADSLVWRSSIDGVLGTGQFFTGTLSAGKQTITLTAKDSQGASASTSVALTVEIPVVTIAGGGSGGGGGGGGQSTSTPLPQATATVAPPTLQATEAATSTNTPEPTPAPVPTEVVQEPATPVPGLAALPPDAADGGGFSSGAIIGIVWGVIAALAVFFVINLVRRNRASARSSAIPERLRLGRIPR